MMLSQRKRVWSLGLATWAVLMVGAPTYSAEIVLYDSNGFEEPRFTPGPLEGQDVAEGPWVKKADPNSGLSSSGEVQTAVVKGGAQAVGVNRVQADSDTRWLVDLRDKPAYPVVTVRWDMLVQPTVSDSEFGPMFGIETYEDNGSEPIKQIGSLYVDATTGEIVYLEDAVVGNGNNDDVGQVAVAGTEGEYNDGLWHSFVLSMDFNDSTYSIFADGQFLAQSTFVDLDLGITRFTDADISAVAADLEPPAQLGTAYVDNYQVTAVPLPGAAWMGLTLLGGCLLRRRRLSC